MDREPISITAAKPDDVPTILDLIRKLAEYERLSHLVVATEQLLHEHLFGPRPAAEAVIARLGGQPVGFALFFQTFSTFLGRPGIWLEDLFVLPEHRRKGIGHALIRAVAEIARQRNAGRLEWSVLDWNQPAIEFYRKLGADVLPDWRICRVSGDALKRFAAE